MQACVEVWESDPAAYHYNAVGYIALGAQVQEVRSRRDVRAAGADRLPLRARSTGEAEVDAHMKAPVPRLARAGRDRLPPRAPGRLRVQPRVGARAPGQVPRGGRLGPRGRRGHGVRVPRRRHGLGRSRRARATIEVGEQVVVAPGPVGRALLVDARPCPTRSTSRRRPARSSATGRCGRTGTSRRARSPSTR